MRPRMFELFCPEHYMEIENYDLAKADNFKGWVCHHRNGVEFDRDWLIKNNMYWNRSDPHEFKFVTRKEHNRIHHTGHERAKGSNNPMYGRKGKNNPNYGSHRSEETKAKMRANASHNHSCLGWKWRIVNGKREYYRHKDD